MIFRAFLALWLLAAPAWAQGTLSTVGAGAGSAITAFTANAVDYDGAADYLSRASGFAGAADSSIGILSYWVRLDGGNGAAQDVLKDQNGNRVIFSRDTSNRFSFELRDSTGLLIFQFTSAATYTSSATWLHVLASWNTNFGIGAKLAQVYVNDVSDVTIVSDLSIAFSADYTVSGWEAAGSAGFLNGCLAELYFAPGQYLDFSVTANRRFFITAAGKPVDLGVNGTEPTGVAPLLYLRGAAAAIGTNSGTGGNMTINGAPATCSTSPSS